MTNDNLTKALVQYRLLEDQKKELEMKQAVLKEQITEHMQASKQENIERNGVVAQFVARTVYKFDVPNILKAVPAVVEHLSLTNAGFMKVFKGNEDKIGSMREVVSDNKSLTIRIKKNQE